MIEDTNKVIEDEGCTKHPETEKENLGFIVIILLIILACAIINLIVVKITDYRINNLELRYEESTRIEGIKQLINEMDNLYNEYYIGEIDYDKIEKAIINGYIEGAGDKYGMYIPYEDMDEYNINDCTLYELETKIVSNTKIELDIPENLRLVDGEQAVKVTEQSDDGKLIVEYNRHDPRDIRYDIIENVGYININKFKHNTGKLLKTIMDEMQNKNIDKFIFDIRENSGGLLGPVVESLDYLLPEGLIVTIEDKNGKLKDFNSDKKHVEGEMVVLVDGLTASAAELFTLVLMEYDKVTVVGTTTYGKGTGTEIFDITNGKIKISTSLYYTKSGKNIEGIGINPDILIRNPQDVITYMARYDEDIQLQKALEILGALETR